MTNLCELLIFPREGLKWSSFFVSSFWTRQRKAGAEDPTSFLLVLFNETKQGHAQIIQNKKGIQLKLNPFFYVL